MLISDRLPAEEFARALDEASDDAPLQKCEIPPYVYDVHTRRGRWQGRTRQQFLVDEHEGLSDSTTIFRNWRAMAESDEWVQPELDL